MEPRGSGPVVDASEQRGAMSQRSELADLARRVTRGSATAWDDAEIRREIGRLQAEYEALRRALLAHAASNMLASHTARRRAASPSLHIQTPSAPPPSSLRG